MADRAVWRGDRAVRALAVAADNDVVGIEYTTFGPILDRRGSDRLTLYGPMRLLEPIRSSPPRAASRHARVTSDVFAVSPAVAQSVVTKARPVADVIGGNLVSLDAAGLHWFQARAPAVGITARLVFNVATSATFLIYETSREGTPVELETDTSMTTPAIRDPYTGTVQSLTLPARERGKPVRLAVRRADRPLVLDFNYGQAPYAVNLETRQASLPPVEEIIARHQQRQTAQDAALRNYTAHLRIEMHFHLSPAEPAYNVTTENRLFAEGAAVEWAEDSFALNGATWTKNRPSFPLLQPEKVLSLPLDLRLNQDYRYHLDGVDTVNGREAYSVSFSPSATTQTLYRGTVWIDRATFARLKVSAVQIGGSGVVQANEEEQQFTDVGNLGGQPVWLLTTLKSKQTLLVAGRTLLNEREVRLSDVKMNAAGFEAARAEARGGDGIMYRDTDQGARFLIKRGGERVVSEKLTSSARAFAMGADIDPSFDYPCRSPASMCSTSTFWAGPAAALLGCLGRRSAASSARA